MGLSLAQAATVVLLGGCSLIYSTGNIPDPRDASIDTPLADADPTMLVLSDVSPRVIFEGQGSGGSRPAVIVVQGMHLVPGATVAITAHAGEVATPLITIDNTKLEVATDGNQLAVPVSLPVDLNIGPGKPAAAIRLDVAVTQPSPDGPITRTLTAVDQPAPDSPALTLEGLDELTGSPALATDVVHRYSRVAVATITAADVTNPLIVRSTSSIEITGAVSVAGSSTGLPGPGGNLGGAGGAGLVGGDGQPGAGMGAGQPNGGGGGFGTQGGAGPGAGGNVSGTVSLATFGPSNRGSGGAGNKGPLIAGSGGSGGGGGGSIELSAGGDLTINGLDARGANGQTSGGTTGGGGSGGAVLLRSGGRIAVTGTGVNAKGGTGAGAGGVGRVRVDAPSKTDTVTSDPVVGYRGPTFAPGTPLIVRSATPTLNVVGQASMLFKYNIENQAGTETRGPVEVSMPSSGELALALTEQLFPGYNRICLLVADASGSADEGQNCITLVYLNKFP